MGILDSIFGKKREEKEQMHAEAPVPKAKKPFVISSKFSSLRLKAGRNSKIFLEVAVKNVSGTKQLVSVDLNLPLNSKIGFDAACSQNYIEKRLGEVQPGAATKFNVPIYASNQTKEGSYTIEINVFAHYLDYRKVLTQMKKKVSLRAVAGS
jgi:uncharacterized membrane protein